MADFPASPISPQEFMEEFVPAAMAEAGVAEAAGDVDVQLGVKLEGDGGGEWVIHIRPGGLKVESGSREATPFTLVQTVEDWRGALWEGRGGVFGAQAAELFKGGGEGAGAGQGPGAGAAVPSAAALDQLGALDGLIRIVVQGGEGGDWATGFKLGPGPVPEAPQTQLVISAEDAQAMQEGSLDPMAAFMGGKIQVTGDMGLMMQMQAISMAAAASQGS